MPALREKSRPSAAAILFVIILIASSAAAVLGQDETETPAPTPTPDAEIERLTREKAIKELEAGIATSEKAIRDAQKTEIEAPDGETTTENVKIETEIMAYRALGSAADMIADDLKNDTSGKKLAILNPQWLNGLRGYWSTFDHLRHIRRGYSETLGRSSAEQEIAKLKSNGASQLVNKTAMTKAMETAITKAMAATIPGDASSLESAEKSGFQFSDVMGAFGTAGSVAGAALDLAALLRASTAVTGTEFTIGESAVASEVYRRLQANGTTRFYPAEFSPNINLRRDYYLLREIEDLRALRQRSENLIQNIDILEKGLGEATKAKKEIAEKIKALNGQLADERFKLAGMKPNEPSKRDVERKIDKLGVELQLLDGDLRRKQVEIDSIALDLTSFYNQLLPQIPAEFLAKAFADLEVEVNEVWTAISPVRRYTLEEIKTLAHGNSQQKEVLAKKWKAEYKSIDALALARLMDPLRGPDRLRIYAKIKEFDSQNGTPMPGSFPARSELSIDDQFKLTFPDETRAAMARELYGQRRKSAVERLRALNAQFDKSVESLVKPDETTGLTPMATHLQTENVMAALGCKMDSGLCNDARVLVLGPVRSGGNLRKSKNLLTMTFLGDALAHSGGAIVEYRLYDMGGNILRSGVCRAYEPYRKPKNVNLAIGKTDRTTCQVQEAPVPPPVAARSGIVAAQSGVQAPPDAVKP